MKKNEKYDKSIRDLIDICNYRGISVNLAKNLRNEAVLEDKIINISSAQSSEHVFYLLLHELGHFIIYNDDKEKYKSKYPGEFSRKNSIKHKVSVIEVEIDAWRAGFHLAKLHGLDFNINLIKWNRLREKCLFAYFQYVVNPSGFNKDENI